MTELPDFVKTRIQNLENAESSLEESELKLFDVPIDLCDPTESNPNSMDQETFNTLTEEIEGKEENTPGFIEPIHVVPLENGRYQIVGGEHRWRAKRSLGHKRIPAIVLFDKKWKSE